MNKYPDEGTQFAVHAAYQDLLELIVTIAPMSSASDQEMLARELRDTVLGLIGAVLGQTEGIRDAEVIFSNISSPSREVTPPSGRPSSNMLPIGNPFRATSRAF